MSVLRVTRWLAISICTLAFTLSTASTGVPAAAAFAAGPHAVIAHAGDDWTAEGGETVTLDASTSWDAGGHALTCTWTQVEGPAVTLDLTDPCKPAFVAPIPGMDGVPAENQVLAFDVTVSDGAATSDPSQARVLVLRPFDPVADGPAVVTNTLVKVGGVYPPGSLGYAIDYANGHPGTRVTFDLPTTDPGYNATGGFWQFPHAGAGSIPMAQAIRGVTIDGFSQRANAQGRGDFVNTDGPALVIPGVILEFGHYFSGAGTAERSIARGLVQEMFVWNAHDLVLSGNYYNVHPLGDAARRGAGEHVGFASGGTTCGRLGIHGGTHVRVGGATPNERNLIGPGCPPVFIQPRNPLVDATFVGNYVGLDRTGSFSIDTGSLYGLGTDGYGANVMDARVGGVTPGSRNVFSGLGAGNGAQFLVTGPNNRVVVQGNYFGLNADGTAAVPNQHGAVFNTDVRHGTGPGELVAGGPEPGAGNVMSGNSETGLLLWKFGGPWWISIHGNRIGTAADGLSAVPNKVGIGTTNTADGIVVGGANPGEGNVVSGNLQSGIRFPAVCEPNVAVRIAGNLIGVGADGVTPVGNGGSGVVTQSLGWGSPCQAPAVGGVGAGEGNVIAHNGVHGVSIDGPNRRGSIRGNSIHSNGALGIGLRGDTELAPLPNNAGDAPRWANEGRNYPVLMNAQVAWGYLTVQGVMDTLPNLGLSLDFYANDAVDPSGNGEGRRYLGTWSFTMPSFVGPGYVFTAQIPASGLDVNVSDLITATATDQSGNTSEFSGAVSVLIVDQTPPTISCPAPITAVADPSGTAVIPNVVAGVTASDDVTPAGSLVLSQTPPAGTPVGVGTHPVTVTATDAAGNSASCTTPFTVEAPPPPPVTVDCSAAAPSIAEIWPPNHTWVAIGITGVTSTSGAVSIAITGILQDEPTNTIGDGNTSIDGGGIGTSVALVRAERSGSPKVPGNGRVYEIAFTATSGGASCDGTVFVGVPHDQGKGRHAVDDIIRYDSTAASAGRVR